YVRFYWDGSQHYRSCGTKQSSKAETIKNSIEQRIKLLKAGTITLPEDLTPPLQVQWILSGEAVHSAANSNGNGSAAGEVSVGKKSDRFGDICAEYLVEQAQKQDTTLAGERIHVKHLKRLLKPRTSLREIDLDSLKQYRDRRRREKYRDKFTSDATVKKELVTFHQIWNWAKNDGRVDELCPLLDDNRHWKIALEKPAEKEKFQTWGQIERRINRGGLSEKKIDELWRGLYLDHGQVMDLLLHVKQTARYDFIYPMFAFTAYTGARRSEVLRSRIDDIDFETEQILIRERKRKKNKRESTRLVPLHPKLRTIVEEWLKHHPGGPYTIQCPREMPRRKPLAEFNGLSVHQGHRHFEATLNNSKWFVVTGFHVLRHSFGSNLIRSGKVPSDVVAKWMGHTTIEMRELYQHLFPQDGLDHICVLD
ncbi:MAG: tyrosine-type recombinase/integrase, partial [Bythopirellula sp.]